jgi:2-oxoglutarate/2-oxoacid ferredoxin oxidoreductase subunit beta
MVTERLEKVAFARPTSMTETYTHYCPGCGHGIIQRLVAEALDELGLREDTVAVAPVGCAAFIYDYWNFDCLEASHGRAPAVATGVKRAQPDKFVFSYQGDGDIAAIGTAEIVHAAVRGELIASLFVNNANYGMTGGQMAPTTVEGQKTSSTTKGRNVRVAGYPIKLPEMLATCDGTAYAVRCAVNTPANVNRTKKAIINAFRTELEGNGFAIVEILSPCPTNWLMTPLDAQRWVGEHLVQTFPLGEIKNTNPW